MRATNNNITDLRENEIFVFGSPSGITITMGQILKIVNFINAQK